MNNSGHAWNIVWIQGQASFIDVTNDIGNKELHINFLRKDDEMIGYSRNEKILPACKLFDKGRNSITVQCQEELSKVIQNKKHNEIHLKWDCYLDLKEIEILIRKCYRFIPYTIDIERKIIYL